MKKGIKLNDLKYRNCFQNGFTGSGKDWSLDELVSQNQGVKKTILKRNKNKKK